MADSDLLITTRNLILPLKRNFLMLCRLAVYAVTEYGCAEKDGHEIYASALGDYTNYYDFFRT